MFARPCSLLQVSMRRYVAVKEQMIDLFLQVVDQKEI